MNKHPRFLPATALAGLLLASCDQSSTENSNTVDSVGTPLRVVAVNEPLACFARHIGGELVEADCPAPADGDPAYWEPSDDEVIGIQQADLILLNGAGYAGWLETASLPESKMVDTSADFTDRLIALEGSSTHSHGPEGAHVHGDTAFTTWLDLDLARRQADAVHRALARELGGNEEALESGRVALAADLEALDEGFKDCGKALGGAPMLASHPVYQYFGRAYALNLESVHWEPDTLPGEEEWKKLAALLRTHPAKWMLWEAEPLPETTRRLDDLGVQRVVVDPCGAPPQDGDFLSVMRANLGRLRKIPPTP